MNITVGTNWDPTLLEELANVPEVTEYMGSLPQQAIGTDRPPMKHPRASWEEIEQHISRIHETGKRFTWLLNIPTGGREWEPGKHSRIVDYVGRIADCGADAVTVAAPGHIEIIKANFPHLQIHMSHNSGITTSAQLKAWSDLGADAACILRFKNRLLPYVEQLVKHSAIPLQITCLSVCVPGCPAKISQYHLSITGAQCVEDGPQTVHSKDGHGFHVAYCHKYRFSNPEELVKGCFIRPDDLHYFEKIGVAGVKLDSRTLPTPGIVARARAYAGQRFEGNLMDLLNVFHMAGFKVPGPPPAQGAAADLTDEQLGDLLFKAARRYDFHELLNFDNRGLDGWMKRMLEKPCTATCNQCDHCVDFADQAMEWNQEMRAELQTLVEEYQSRILNRGGHGTD